MQRARADRFYGLGVVTPGGALSPLTVAVLSAVSLKGPDLAPRKQRREAGHSSPADSPGRSHTANPRPRVPLGEVQHGGTCPCVLPGFASRAPPPLRGTDALRSFVSWSPIAPSSLLASWPPACLPPGSATPHSDLGRVTGTQFQPPLHWGWAPGPAPPDLPGASSPARPHNPRALAASGHCCCPGQQATEKRQFCHVLLLNSCRRRIGSDPSTDLLGVGAGWREGCLADAQRPGSRHSDLRETKLISLGQTRSEEKGENVCESVSLHDVRDFLSSFGPSRSPRRGFVGATFPECRYFSSDNLRSEETALALEQILVLKVILSLEGI
ncbi:uncharacterized protein LOC124993177 isoform X2 [Sciurus carolinensis]|uniref:uncharacterized protein LOC124993177 isoform X2 n=1 Tax=Sciurus carolinensis TaxID=30640 RepID=UPI001FB2BD5D|nr:uncharacterized protein LOC124993177 isoform X2 [Sciurus carolinensis]XP_047420800.1 uncharacterized protein LOC124993177 isoform X2 [Sciurus carolinensis]